VIHPELFVPTKRTQNTNQPTEKSTMSIYALTRNMISPDDDDIPPAPLTLRRSGPSFGLDPLPEDTSEDRDEVISDVSIGNSTRDVEESPSVTSSVSSESPKGLQVVLLSADESRDGVGSPGFDGRGNGNNQGDKARRKQKYDRYRKLQHTKSIFGRDRKVPLKYANALSQSRGPFVSDPFYS
jgi:hypothetical protein